MLWAFAPWACGCGGPRVEARAIWVDGLAEDDLRRIHVYDRGERYTLSVEGKTDPREHVRLSPDGRGVLARAGDRRGVWLDLDDGRRLPLILPSQTIAGTSVDFCEGGEALRWLDPDTSTLQLLPLAPGLALARDGDGGLLPLSDPEPIAWARGSTDAPLLLVAHVYGGARLLRYPTQIDDTLGLVDVAVFDGVALPSTPTATTSCDYAPDCRTNLAIAPDGSWALAEADYGNWVALDRDRGASAGPIELPEPLMGAFGLLAVLDDSVSVWLEDGQLHRWDRATGELDSTPVFAQPPLHWALVDRGHAVVLLSTNGPMIRVDAERIEILNLETTDCVAVSGPVIAPDGRRAAWTCRDGDAFDDVTASVVVRASRDGLERHAGIAMEVVAIDDGGELLLDSVESISTDLVDGVSSTARPLSLFVLSSRAVLSRIDDLEPTPTPVDIGDRAVYLQAAAL